MVVEVLLQKRSIWPKIMTHDVLCLIDNCVNDENAWIMDLGASQHMTPIGIGLRHMSLQVERFLWEIIICARL